MSNLTHSIRTDDRGIVLENGFDTMSNQPSRLPTGWEGKLPKSTIFDVLQNHPCRDVLESLKRFDDSVKSSDRMAQITAWEHQTLVEEVMTDQKKRGYTTLQHPTHSKLENAALINSDGRNLVMWSAYTEELTVYWDIVSGFEFSRRAYSLLVGSVGCAIVAALWTDLFPLTLLTPMEWATVVAVTFTVVVVLHRRVTRRRETCPRRIRQRGDRWTTMVLAFVYRPTALDRYQRLNAGRER